MNLLTRLYGGIAGLRNSLFDRGVLPTRRLQEPVVSIGNLSVGGSGKTPFVIALGELLKERGVRFDVLSRGYGRKTRGAAVVKPEGNAADFGDEPLLIARRLGIPVIVGESRYQAGRIAEQKFQSQLHILDDGFQHRSLARDFEIVLMTARDFEDRLLPLGGLREPLSSLRRADAIVVPESASLQSIETLVRQLLTAEQLAVERPFIWHIKRQLQVSSVIPAPIVFCGIARPQQFFDQVRAAGIIPAKEISFRDHHAYTASDIRRLLALRGKLNGSGFLTTEKDAVNLGSLKENLNPLQVASLTLTLEDPNDVLDTILARTILAKEWRAHS